ncbi:MAG: sigma 54-interacting transcriptional regulator [Sandaracinaceae bacterium]
MGSLLCLRMGERDGFTGIETYRLGEAEATVDAHEPGWLVVLSSSASRVIELRRGTTRTLGRSSECDVQLADRAISRKHAVLHVGDTVVIEDLGSANGVMVSGVRVGERARAVIPVGAAVTLGETLLVLQRGAEPPRLEAAPAIVPPASDRVVADPAMRELYSVIARVAPTRLNVLLLGETGTGKELLAEALHAGSPRAPGPFVRLNCASLNPGLLESELFGHERGAFTGADRERTGLLEAADGGTLLLDEVGDMPVALQAKLLRAIEDGRVTRVGSVRARSVDVRFVAATHRDLEAEVAAGRFRQDLFYRLQGIRLDVPPLRDRPSEIVPLARAFAERLSPGATVGPEVEAALLLYAWPGNVRELRNAIERALALGGGRLAVEHLPAAVTGDPAAARADKGELREDLAGIEKRRIVAALAQCDGNQTKAAKLLGMPRRTLISRIEEYDLPRPRKGRG